MANLDISVHNNRVFDKYAESTRKRIISALNDIKQPVLEYLETEISNGGGWVYDHQTKYKDGISHNHSITMWTVNNQKGSDKTISLVFENNAEHPYNHSLNYSQFLIGQDANNTFNAAKSGLTESEWNKTKSVISLMAKEEIKQAIKSRKLL